MCITRSLELRRDRGSAYLQKSLLLEPQSGPKILRFAQTGAPRPNAIKYRRSGGTDLLGVKLGRMLFIFITN